MRTWLPALVLLLGGALAYWLGQTGPKPPEERKASRPPLVHTISPRARTHTIEVTGHGLVVPAQEITIHPELVAKVLEQHPHLSPGGHIPKGERILRLDPIDYELAMEQKRALVAQAQLEREVEAARKTVADREWQLLGKANANATGLANRQSHERSAEARLASARSNMKLARLQLDRTRIRSPFNAMVQSESVEVGQVVFPQSAVAHLVGTDTYWVRVDLPLHQLDLIDLPALDQQGGASAIVEQSSRGTSTRFEGRILRLLSQVEPRARMAQLLVEVRDPLGLQTKARTLPLFLGATVKVKIHGKQLPDALEIPGRALRADDRVWLASTENTLQVRQVRVLHRGANHALIAADLEADARIITSHLDIPIENMALRPGERPGKAADQTRDVAARQ